MLKDHLIIVLIRVFIALITVFLILSILKFNKLPSQLPLFYSLPKGEEQLGRPTLLISIPLFSILIFTLNFVLGSIWFTKDKIMTYILVVSADIFTLLFLITFIKIIFLVA